MSFFSSIESIVNSHFDFPAFVLNNSGVVEIANKKASELFVVDQVVPFFNLFEGENSIIAERVFLESKNNDREVEENISFLGQRLALNKDLVLRISPFNFDKENYFFVSLVEIETENNTFFQSKIKSFSQSEFHHLSEENVIKVVDEIKSSYPFTLIEKKRLQKEIDEISIAFWIKDADGKYIIVNKRFKSLLNLGISKIEGKKSKDIFSKNVSKLFEMAEDFVVKSLNGIVLEGISDNFELDGKSQTQIVELPISDVEKNIVVTVGFTNEIKFKDYSYDVDNVLSNFIKALPSSAVLLNNNFNIEVSNSNFNEIFNAKANSEKINLQQIISPDFFKKIELQLKDNSFDESIQFTHQQIIGKELSKINIIITKIPTKLSSGNKYLLVLSIEGSKISQQTVKEKMYDIIMKTSPEAIFIYEIDNLQFIEVNDSALQIYGYNREEFLQMDLTDLYAPEDIQTLLESTNDKQNARGVYTGPFRHKRKNGSSLLVEISKTEIDYNSKKSHLNVIHNITEEINNKKQLQLFKSSFENFRDLIILTDAEGFITFANEPVNKILGFYDSELEKRPFLSLLSDGDRAKVNTNIFHSGKNETNTFDIQLKNSDGEFIAAKIIATPILNFRNEVESFSLIILPQNVNKEIQAVSHEPKEIKTKGDLDPSFLSNLFHELLTPINVIIGFVQELVESIENPSEEQKESADIIKENQKVLLQTMDTAVEYSHLEQENIEIKSEKVMFVDILDVLEEDTHKESVSQKTELSYSKISSSLSIITDKHRFTTLITLFVKFAMKMTKEEKLFLSAYNYGDDSFVVSLKDNRKGITPNLLKNLRELFSADESVIRHSFDISRFSVRLIRRLTNLLAEKREVILKKDEPFEFGFIFPMELKNTSETKTKGETKPKVKSDGFSKEETISNAEGMPIEQISEQKETADIDVPTTVTVKIPKLKTIDYSQLSCLYVEDQIDSQILFKVQMKELKSMDFVTNFEDALPLLKTKSFNFIVMDINLQGEYNGLDALHIIRNMPVYQDVPVIAVSAYVLPGDRENFISAGFNDFITKPVLQDKLYDSLRKIF